MLRRLWDRIRRWWAPDEPPVREPGYSFLRFEEWSKYPREYPTAHTRHDRSWTQAPGVWYCYDCGQHYRTWGWPEP